jgi:hypothetical protein
MNKAFYLSVVAILVLLGYQYNLSQKVHTPNVAEETRWTFERQKAINGEYQELLFFNQGESKPLFTIEFFGSVNSDYSIESLQSSINRDLHDMGLVHSEADYNSKLMPLINGLKSDLLGSGAEAIKINLPTLDTRFLLTRKTTAQ